MDFLCLMAITLLQTVVPHSFENPCNYDSNGSIFCEYSISERSRKHKLNVKVKRQENHRRHFNDFLFLSTETEHRFITATDKQHEPKNFSLILENGTDRNSAFSEANEKEHSTNDFHEAPTKLSSANFQQGHVRTDEKVTENEGEESRYLSNESPTTTELKTKEMEQRLNHVLSERINAIYDKNFKKYKSKNLSQNKKLSKSRLSQIHVRKLKTGLMTESKQANSIKLKSQSTRNLIINTTTNGDNIFTAVAYYYNAGNNFGNHTKTKVPLKVSKKTVSSGSYRKQRKHQSVKSEKAARTKNKKKESVRVARKTYKNKAKTVAAIKPSKSNKKSKLFNVKRTQASTKSPLKMKKLNNNDNNKDPNAQHSNVTNKSSNTLYTRQAHQPNESPLVSNNDKIVVKVDFSQTGMIKSNHSTRSTTIKLLSTTSSPIIATYLSRKLSTEKEHSTLPLTTTAQQSDSIILNTETSEDKKGYHLWDTCSGNITLESGSSKAWCQCRNLVTSRQRYPCFSCSCENIEKVIHLPDFIMHNVFDLTIKHSPLTTLDLGQSNRSLFGFINLQKLSIDNSRISKIDYSAINKMKNLEVLKISDCHDLLHIDHEIFNGSQSLADLSVENTNLETFYIDPRVATSLKKLTLLKNRLTCGCQLEWSKSDILTKEGDKLKIIIDACYFRGLTFDISQSTCSVCKELTDSHRCYSEKGCAEIYNNVWCYNISKGAKFDEQAKKCEKSVSVLVHVDCQCSGDVCSCTNIADLGSIDSVLPKKLKKLIIYNSTFKSFRSENLCAFPYLEEFVLIKGSLDLIQDYAFENNRMLSLLRIEDNEGTLSLGSKSFLRTFLKNIVLRNTTLKGIENIDLRDNSKYVESVEFSDANLESFPPLLPLNHLKNLNLTGNKMKDFSITDFNGLSDIETIDLRRNAIECSCKNSWIHNWLNRDTGNHHYPNLYARLLGAKCMITDHLEAELALYDPCHICETYTCPPNHYCKKESNNVSKCIELETIDIGNICTPKDFNTIRPVKQRCDQFIRCDEDVNGVVMSCPTSLFFDSKSSTCIPIHLAECLHPVETMIYSEREKIEGFECPRSILSWGYDSLNRKLKDEWNDFSERSESIHFQSTLEFIETYGVYRHDRHDCNGYHRCHYSKENGSLMYSKPYRCPSGFFFDTQYDRCLDMTEHYMTTNPDLHIQCRCNVIIYQQRFVQRYREEYNSDPPGLPFNDPDNDPCPP